MRSPELLSRLARETRYREAEFCVRETCGMMVEARGLEEEGINGKVNPEIPLFLGFRALRVG